ncbi:DUF2778 domain-containing protein [Burkholderia latens]|uniref:DUF2778 domain-containing protein n=2 Tax=Burkholderia latens TaxID=488446 RepID=A0A6H9SXL0_9BURK|nr:DUF2778 domain-containing protein [Burkholderia latens]KAB0636404.1 DUF2778 domain-containing protein [Burkholderia latens]VWB41586.1 miscellaneous; unknown [Burkholderia latens]
MLECTFALNDRNMSALQCGALSFPALSGSARHRNRRSSSCLAGEGAIPPGRYYIVDRPTGGMLGPLREFFRDKRDWFALYAADSNIDDYVLCDDVRRGNFRLHPEGVRGISRGCITVESTIAYARLRDLLIAQKPAPIPGSSLQAYRTVTVR